MPDLNFDVDSHKIAERREANRPKVPQDWRNILIENKGKSLAIVFEECSAYEACIVRDGKKLFHQLRHISEVNKNEFVNAKMKDYDTKHDIFTGTALAVGYIVGAAMGPAGQMAMQGINRAVEGVEKQYTNRDQINQTAHDHLAQHAGMAIDEYRGNAQSQEQRFLDMQSQIDRIASLTQDLRGKAMLYSSS